MDIIFVLASLTVVLTILYAYWKWNQYNRSRLEELDGRAILITGCDSGFGHDLALKCLKEIRSSRVFACCYFEEGAKELKIEADQLKQQLKGWINSEGSFHTIVLDVANQTSVENAVEYVQKNVDPNKGLFALVNNAGIVGNAAWDDWLTVKDYQDVWDVNTLGVIRVTQAFKELIKSEYGRIITTASVCGRVAIPALGPYTVSKFAVEGYCDTLRWELLDRGVKVITIEPGFFRTPMTNLERNKEMVKRLWLRAPEKVRDEYGTKMLDFSTKCITRLLSGASKRKEWVVDAYFDAITSKRPKQRYQVGYDARLFYIPFSILPTPLQDFFFKGFILLLKPKMGNNIIQS